MHHRRLGLMAMMAAALLAGASIVNDSAPGLARVVGALALVLILPGYPLTKLLPYGLQASWWTTLLIASGFSMAATALGGLLLNLTPAGIDKEGFAVWLVGVTLVTVGLALVRGRSNPVMESGISFSVRGAALLAAATVVATLAVTLAHWGATQVSSPDATQLWLLANDRADAGGVMLGLRNLEATVKTYRLAVVSGDMVLFEWRSVVLRPSELWQVDLDIPADEPLSPALEARLYVADSDAVYRRAVLWWPPFDRSPPSPTGFERLEASGGE